MSVLIADDDRRFRDALRQLLACEPHVAVAEARDGGGVPRCLQPAPWSRRGVWMPRLATLGLGGRGAAPRIGAHPPATTVTVGRRRWAVGSPAGRGPGGGARGGV